ncbi:MAG TPA: hypothetical protein VKB86_05920 [Pyrinomonadaceae bacterium]|nr:hypothetical protein [Pyrinomonadaceae bacterium]
MERIKEHFQRFTATCLSLALSLLIASCGGSLYKVRPKVDAPIVGGKEVSAGGFTLRAVALFMDEESQELFEANLPLAGLLPVRIDMSNESGSPLLFKHVHFRLRDGEGREWKARSIKQTVSIILKTDEIYLYNPKARKKFEEDMSAHAFDTRASLDAGRHRRGLIFFQTPNNEQVANQHGLVLSIEGLPQPIEIELIH